jgi:thioesterase III
MAMDQSAHEYQLCIVEQHLDTYGHVNNAKYLEILEAARWEWITQGGYGMVEIHARQIGPLVLECKLRFMRELRLREEVRVHSRVVDYVGKIAHVQQDVWRVETGEQSLAGEFVLALFDLRARRVIEPTAEWLTAIGMSERYTSKPKSA